MPNLRLRTGSPRMPTAKLVPDAGEIRELPDPARGGTGSKLKQGFGTVRVAAVCPDHTADRTSIVAGAMSSADITVLKPAETRMPSMASAIAWLIVPM